MKPPHDPPDEHFDNIPELINHLWDLYSAMTLDPALADSAAHIRKAVVELQNARQAAWEVCQEKGDTSLEPRRAPSKKTRKKRAEHDARWLKSVRPASPLKQ